MANRYGKIIVSTPECGRRETGIVTGTLYPGTCVTVEAATEPINGRFTYEAYNRSADGVRAPVAVLLEDELQGKLVTTIGVSDDYRELYFPAEGELLQMLVANVAGTSDTFAIGDDMMIDDGTGKLIAATGEESTPFQIMETVGTAITADTLVLCKYTGR